MSLVISLLLLFVAWRIEMEANRQQLNNLKARVKALEESRGEGRQG